MSGDEREGVTELASAASVSIWTSAKGDVQTKVTVRLEADEFELADLIDRAARAFRRLQEELARA